MKKRKFSAVIPADIHNGITKERKVRSMENKNLEQYLSSKKIIEQMLKRKIISIEDFKKADTYLVKNIVSKLTIFTFQITCNFQGIE